MSQDVLTPTEEKPLSAKQRAFARELGPVIAAGSTDKAIVEAYVSAGYKPNRGNARRLASDPRVKKIADEACAEALRLAGLHIGYLQAKALELLHASSTKIHRALSSLVTAEISTDKKGHVRAHFRLRDDLTPEEEAAIDAATWPLSKFQINEKGVITVELPDKKGIIEMLGKQLGHGKDEPANLNLSLETLVLQSMQPREPASI